MQSYYNYLIFIVLLGCLFSCETASYEQYAREDSLPDQVDFNFHIKPILSDRCFACHGPDADAREADFRLDTEEGAFAALSKESDKYAIRAGKLTESEVWHRIISQDPEITMPPPESNLSLTGKEIALIGKWIDQGATWKKHWSFIAPRESDLPEVKDEKWVTNPIDRFVLAKLEKEGLTPNAQTHKEALIRRLSFDLTGLPPTLEEIDDFLQDNSADAYEKIIDRLLNSPAYGERMAVDWLDVARYADTHGYQADRERRMWPWRDWVIKAFNNNMPYDEFSRWQLAGDLLPNATREQILATAFNRNHMQTEEGGSVEEEFRTEYVADRSITTSRAFLGLTLECARCHDHKYDPISQKEFYSFFGFFNSVDESGQTSHFTDAVPVPTLLLSDEQVENRIKVLSQQIESLEKESNKDPTGFEKWLETKYPTSLPLRKGLQGHFSFDAIKQNKITNHANRSLPAHLVDAPILTEGKQGKALKMSGENGLSFKDLGVFSRSDPFSLSIWVKATEKLDRAVIVHRTQAVLDAGSRGYELMIDKGKISLALTHMWPHNEIRKLSKIDFPTQEWVHLAMTYDGSSKASGLKLYMNGKETSMDIIRDNLHKDILYERVEVNLTLGYRFRGKGFKNGLVDEFRIYARNLSALEIAELHTKGSFKKIRKKEQLALTEKKLLQDYYTKNHDPVFLKTNAELQKLRKEETKLIDTVSEIMVMKDLPMQRPTFVLTRGAYDQPADEVKPNTPAAVLPFSEELAPNRLGLAKWLFDKENPLTSRVMVNRIWQMHFGKGLVSTPEDFGNQGALPTHPALLDYLAIRFRESGWDIKALHKLILQSSAYRQSSIVSQELRELDPENNLLARGPSFRLPAEMVRDQALASSGLLVQKLGGPSVKPYQPDGLWKEKSGRAYIPDKGEGLYRRSLYTFWKRTSPPPNMITFDASERNVCIVKRQATSTPLQALVLLNDVQFTEAARVLGEKMMQTSPEMQEQIIFAFRSLTAREPRKDELKVLENLYSQQLAEFNQEESKAISLLSEGEFPYNQSLNVAELASCTVVANALFNFDESIMLR